MADIVLQNLCKSYDGSVYAVDHVDLHIADGEFLVLVGPSGCGKSTALRMIAGLEDITDGSLHIAGAKVNDLSPRQRNIAMVFQSYALYPSKTVFDNIAFPLRMQGGLDREAIRQKVLAVSASLELEDLLGRLPKALSGGQRQRVAMARALVRDPVAFLMDEPLSNLDAKLRVQMRQEILALKRKTGTTTVYVTHDQVEAMTMGDRVAVLDHGVLQQVAAPQHLYLYPDNIFVATFIGSPAMSIFQPQWKVTDERTVALRFGGHDIPLPESVAQRWGGVAGMQAAAQAGIRPEHWQRAESDHGVEVQVLAVEQLGHEQLLQFSVAGDDSLRGQARLDSSVLHSVGSPLRLQPDLQHIHLFAEDGRRCPDQAVLGQ